MLAWAAMADSNRSAGADVIDCQCPCGTVKLRVRRPPKTRFYCHCTTCQSYYGTNADAAVLVRSDVEIEGEEHLDYERNDFPWMLQRGICRSCKRPALSVMPLPPWPTLAIVPVYMFPEGAPLPEPNAHLFAHRAEGPLDDGVKQHDGYVSSMLGGLRLMFAGMP